MTSTVRIFSSLSASLLLACLAPAPGIGHEADSGRADIYPTDRCVSDKLEAAADQCKRVLGLWAKHAGESDAKRAKGLLKAEKKLAKKWARAERRSSARAVDCAASGVGSSELIESLAAGAARIAAQIAAEPDESREREHRRRHKKSSHSASRRIKAAANACRDLLDAQSEHLARRAQDRLRSGLAADAGAALDRFHRKWRKHRHAERTAGALEQDVALSLQELVDEVVADTSVSREVSPDWTRIDPDPQVEYNGVTLAPTCSDGSPYAFWARRGTVNKLLVYYQGGGACWNQITCGGVPEFGVSPTFDQTVTAGDHPSRATTGFANMTNPDNPFRDWNVVFVPYCTGDVHWGDAVFDHRLGSSRVTTIHHKGFVNAQVVEKWTREHFVNPQQVFVTGSSAGAYGAIMNSLPLQKFVYPSADVAVLGDGGNGVITSDFLVNDIGKWGVEQNLPDYIPELNVPLAQLDAADLWSASAKHFPENRFATYATAYDGGFGGQVGFYHIMLNPLNVFVWTQWWHSACAWNAVMRSQNQAAAATAPNFRFYVGSGSRHTMWGSDKVYTDTTGGVPTILEWVEGMIDATPAWTNVECSDCGVVLPGDPRPSPLELPFTPDGRIACD